MSKTLRVDTWQDFLKGQKLQLCGIHNVTPDSFSDGGQYQDYESSLVHISELVNQGAGIIDVGAESSRPGALEVDFKTEIKRLEPIFSIIQNNNFDKTLFSIDTRHSQTALAAINAGFGIINDVSAGTFDSKIIEVVAQSKILFIAMHSRGIPQTMQGLNEYTNVVDRVGDELESRVADLVSNGIAAKRIMVDPGIGFAKNVEQNLEILENLESLKLRLGLPMMLGISRKSVVGHIIRQKGLIDNAETRDVVSAEMCDTQVLKGVDVLRVHNIVKHAHLVK